MSESTQSKERASFSINHVQQEVHNSESETQQSSDNKIQAGEKKTVDADESDKALPTIGQLMRATAQSVQRFYRAQLGHSPSRVTCHVVADKLIIWAENSVTSIEKMLYESDRPQLESIRRVIDDVCRQQLIDIIEQKLEVEVVALIADTCYEQECTGLIASLSAQPRVRNSRHSSVSSSR